MVAFVKEIFPNLLQFERAVQYSILFGLLCAINHGFSVMLFHLCGYCLVRYSVAYIVFLMTTSLLLSNVLFRAFVRRDEKRRILKELRTVTSEDIPYVMIQLIQKSRGREMSNSTSQKRRPDGDEEKLCVACYERAPLIKNIPCGHVVLCKECNWSLLKVSIENRSLLSCSWCRTGIKEFEGEMRPDLDLIEWEDIQTALNTLESVKSNRKQNSSDCF